MGDGLPAHINAVAAKTVLEESIKGVRESKAPDSISKNWPPDTEYIITQVRESREIQELLQIKAWRLELGLAVAFICAFLVWYREELKIVLPEDRLIIQLRPSETGNQEPPLDETGDSSLSQTVVRLQTTT